MARPRKQVSYNRRSSIDRREEYKRVHTLIYDNARKYRKAELQALGYSNGWQIVKEDIGGLKESPRAAEIDRLWEYLEDEEWKEIIDRTINAELRHAEKKRIEQEKENARRAEWQRKYDELVRKAGKAYDNTAPPGRVLIREGSLTFEKALSSVGVLWDDIKDMGGQKAGALFDYMQTMMENATDHDDGTDLQYVQVIAILMENMILEHDAYDSWNEYSTGSHVDLNRTGIPPERVVYDSRHGVGMGPGKLGLGIDKGKYLSDQTLDLLDRAMDLLYFGEDFLTMFWRFNPITASGSVSQNWGWGY